MKWRDRTWACKCAYLPGAKGTLKEWEKYGDDLVCVRYRYDDQGFRIKTVELVVKIDKVR